MSVGPSVHRSGNIFEFRAFFALLLLPNRPQLYCRVSGLVSFSFSPPHPLFQSLFTSFLFSSFHLILLLISPSLRSHHLILLLILLYLHHLYKFISSFLFFFSFFIFSFFFFFFFFSSSFLLLISSSFFLLLLLLFSRVHATLQPALSVSRTVTLYFFL